MSETYKIASWRIVGNIRELNPIGAAVIFGLAWIAGMLGSFAALAVAAALLLGIFAVRAAAEHNPELTPEARTLREEPAYREPIGLSTNLLHPFAASGLVINRLEFKQPTNGRAAK